LNGKSLGKRKKAAFEYRLQWNEVIYNPGELKVKVWKNGEEWAEDLVKTTTKPAKLNLEADRIEIIADGKDLVFVTVNIVDKNNLLVPKSDNMVHFDVEGPGEIIAVGNGDPTSHEPFIEEKRSAFNGKILVVIRSKKTMGTIILKAKSKGLLNSSVEIKATQ
jgi:beta-galactosidase